LRSSARSEPVCVKTSRIATPTIAIATTPKSSGASSRARTIVLTKPMPRITQRIEIIQNDPRASSRPASIGGLLGGSLIDCRAPMARGQRRRSG
jgi:hypothetical protein